MTNEERTTKYLEACRMLVELAAEDVNIRSMATELLFARDHAHGEMFDEVVEEIADAYQHA